MSTENVRDTQFANFARLLLKEFWPELLTLFSNEPANEVDEIVKKQVEQIIARRVFDLAEHVIKHQHGSDLDEMKEGLAHFLEVSYPDYDRLPDMTAFPDQPN